MFTEIEPRFLGGLGPLNHVNDMGKTQGNVKTPFAFKVEGYLTSSQASKTTLSAMPADIKFRADHSDIRT